MDLESKDVGLNSHGPELNKNLQEANYLGKDEVCFMSTILQMKPLHPDIKEEFCISNISQQCFAVDGLVVCLGG